MVKSVNIKDLKKYSKTYQKNKKKELMEIKNNKIDDYNFGVIKNYIFDEEVYEVYLFAESADDIATSLLYKVFSSKFTSNIYYNFLTFIIRGNNKNKILKRISFFIK